MAYSTPGLLTDESRWLARLERMQRMAIHAINNSSYNPQAISGASTFSHTTTSTYTNAVTGGVWASSNTGVATINSSTGIATGVAAGTVTFTYTITDPNSIAHVASKTVTVS